MTDAFTAFLIIFGVLGLSLLGQRVVWGWYVLLAYTALLAGYAVGNGDWNLTLLTVTYGLVILFECIFWTRKAMKPKTVVRYKVLKDGVDPVPEVFVRFMCVECGIRFFAKDADIHAKTEHNADQIEILRGELQSDLS